MNQTYKELREDALATLLAQPDVYLLIEKVTSVLREEQLLLSNFYINNLSGKRSEFINGSIIPISLSALQEEVCLMLGRLLDEFITDISTNFLVFNTMVAFGRNCYQPNISFYRKDKIFSIETLPVLPPPNLVVEVLGPSTQLSNRIIKFIDYQAHKVEEYWIVDPQNHTIEQYHLVEGEYVLILKSSQGFVESFVINGFKIPVVAIFSEAENLKALQNLL
ncbi:Uma2 family endonuclease [Dyadobacter psychrophilus]|uniref:Endonuclease, Uma2 family (Restriction endonuclease fold) n=1 Tax=Dyadobacter psychrophilus TaxID=651661 RepID=A0A1T5GR27_9BACT|nr:Uma2 family endonuclease [Dyadobacter psychrophilus]SKC10885.1 Endonuclease, Uma2 family (restriction endonuclease fold) [Dyadobacter psychrophilus]